MLEPYVLLNLFGPGTVPKTMKNIFLSLSAPMTLTRGNHASSSSKKVSRNSFMDNEPEEKFYLLWNSEPPNPDPAALDRTSVTGKLSLR